MKCFPRLSASLLLAGTLFLFAGAASTLPFAVYSGNGDQKETHWVSSGWMGNTKAVAMDAACTSQPHSGKTCIKVDYKEAGDWAGVVWQDPVNDWGEKDGGYDLTGAKKLSFWARGAKGGEKVKFGFGLLGSDKKFSDSGSADSTVELTTEWKEYTLDVSSKNLSKIKTGFYWVVAGQGAPLAFYLDDIRFE